MTPDALTHLAGPFLVGFIALLTWSIAWKGLALWVAAKNTHKVWFVLLLIINTAGILEIIYIFFVGKPALKKKAGVMPSSSPV